MTGVQVTRGYGLLENYLNKKRCAIANRLIPPSLRKGRILDIGCGTFPRFLYSTSFAEKYGLDQVVSASNRFVKEKIYIQEFNLGSNTKLPFEDGFFDVVTMLALIEHLEYDTTADLLGEVYRILRPDGVCILTTPAKWVNILLKSMAWFRLVSPREIEEHKCLYDPNKILELFKLNQFREDDIDTGFFETHMNIWAKATKAV